ncbi:MAG: hypothetical protein J3R72DRAFT_437671 [Linnemannia gamsii]|nr:MAG: hypothetical protein J3R72DRAFT_437671 [Linnemannia gamsii]
MSHCSEGLKKRVRRSQAEKQLMIATTATFLFLDHFLSNFIHYRMIISTFQELGSRKEKKRDRYREMRTSMMKTATRATTAKDRTHKQTNQNYALISPLFPSLGHFISLILHSSVRTSSTTCQPKLGKENINYAMFYCSIGGFLCQGIDEKRQQNQS